MKKVKSNSLKVTERHILILISYRAERNKSQVRDAIFYHTGKDINFARHILPMTQELIDYELIVRTNPNSPNVKGHKHLITQKGEKVINKYFEMLNDISKPIENLGY